MQPWMWLHDWIRWLSFMLAIMFTKVTITKSLVLRSHWPISLLTMCHTQKFRETKLRYETANWGWYDCEHFWKPLLGYLGGATVILEHIRLHAQSRDWPLYVAHLFWLWHRSWGPAERHGDDMTWFSLLTTTRTIGDHVNLVDGYA